MSSIHRDIILLVTLLQEINEEGGRLEQEGRVSLGGKHKYDLAYCCDLEPFAKGRTMAFLPTSYPKQWS